MDVAPFDWPRRPRNRFDLGRETGVYALFLRQGSRLPGIEHPPSRLLYAGKAEGTGGLRGRCHFLGSTSNHSPRKSLAVLLMEELGLRPIGIAQGDEPHTWGLEPESEARLTEWMFANLELAIELCGDPDARETEIVSRLAPPLNLAKCAQTEQHRRISRARKAVRLSVAPGVVSAPEPRPRHVARKERPNVDVAVTGDIETAEEMAARYGLFAKSFRSALRRSIGRYRKPQIWAFPVGSRQHRDMEEVAMRLAGRVVFTSAQPTPA